MIHHDNVSGTELKELIQTKKIQFGGNLKLKIYGTLSCNSGKRMKKQNRVFFLDEKQAKSHGFRPCGHCLRYNYLNWIAQESG